MLHTPSEKLRYFIYARKSSESEDRQMASIDSQIDELKKLAKESDLNVVRIFSESKSAKAPGREVFADMIQRIKKGEADGIICWKLNRLARNPIDGGEVSWMLQQSIVKHIFTYGRSYYSTDNVIVMAVELGMANQFVRDLSVDAKRGLRSKAERGWYPSFSTLGYIHNPLKKKGDKEINKDGERFNLVRKMFDLMLSGSYSTPKIWEIATKEWGLRNKQGGKIAKSTVYRILTDPFYYGEFEYPKGTGNWYVGKHEPMITKDEYDRIQELLGTDGRPRPKTHAFAFTGMIRCGECGCLITAEDKVKRQKNGNVHNYTYYHCTKKKEVSCSQKTIRDSKLEEQIAEELLTITIPPEFREWALQAIQEENRREFTDKKSLIESQQKAYNACMEEFDGLITMRAKDQIDDEAFLRRKTPLEQEKKRLKKLLEESDKAIDDWLEKAEVLFGFAETASWRFKTGQLQDKKEVLAYLGSNLLLTDRKLLITKKNELLAIKEMAKEEKAIRARLEPLGFGSDKTKLWAEYARTKPLLPLVNKLRTLKWGEIAENLKYLVRTPLGTVLSVSS
jgi:site-specific DNA recombinase